MLLRVLKDTKGHCQCGKPKPLVCALVVRTNKL